MNGYLLSFCLVLITFSYDRKHYQQLWMKHPTDFQTALRLYDDKLRQCGRRSNECNEITSTTAKPVSETENTTEVQKPTMNIHPEDGTAQPTELVIGTEGSCALAFNGTCYWTHVENDNNVNFSRAEEICSNNASIPAYFPNEIVYNSVAGDLRSKIPTRRSDVSVWTGVTNDTNTGDLTPNEDTYVKWYPNYPGTGSLYEMRTKVALVVSSNPNFIYQGMLNGFAHWDYYGVVCQKTIE